jgi:hypothetical protein
MRSISVCLISVLGLCMVSLVESNGSAQQTTASTEVKQFEIVSVDGNRVVVKGDQGAREITVPDDFKLTVDGQPVSVRDLKPGMKGTATITTTTTSTPVHVTEVRNGEVMQKTGNSIIVRGPNGIQMFTQGDVAKRGVKIMKDGRPIDITELNQGDRLTATIVTEGPPKVMTERQVQANLSSPAAPAAQAAPPAAATPPAGTAATSGRRLPRTASALPVVGLLGAASLAVALILTARRRRRAT